MTERFTIWPKRLLSYNYRGFLVFLWLMFIGFTSFVVLRWWECSCSEAWLWLWRSGVTSLASRSAFMGRLDSAFWLGVSSMYKYVGTLEGLRKTIDVRWCSSLELIKLSLLKGPRTPPISVRGVCTLFWRFRSGLCAVRGSEDNFLYCGYMRDSICFRSDLFTFV